MFAPDGLNSRYLVVNTIAPLLPYSACLRLVTKLGRGLKARQTRHLSRHSRH